MARRSIPTDVRRKVDMRSDGHCEICDKGFVKPNYRHRDGNRNNNNPNNIEVICSGCHEKLTNKPRDKDKYGLGW